MMTRRPFLVKSWRKKLACDIQLKNTVIRYLKKIKERKLKERFVDLIYTTIADDPESGDAKTGDLSGIYTMGFRYQKTEYRVAYMISPPTTVIVLLAGSHEDFYTSLKRQL